MANVRGARRTIISSGNPFGPQLIINGDFSGGLTGWTSTGTPTTLEVVGNELHVVDDTANGGAYQNVASTINEAYVLSFDYRVISGTMRVDFTGFMVDVPQLTGTGTYSLEQNAVAGGTTSLFFRTFAAAGEFYTSNVSFKKVL